MPKTFWSDALVAALIRARKGAGLSQAAVAQSLRCQQSLIARILSGERRINFVEFVILCRAFGIDPSHVLHEVAPLIPVDAGI